MGVVRKRKRSGKKISGILAAALLVAAVLTGGYFYYRSSGEAFRFDGKSVSVSAFQTREGPFDAYVTPYYRQQLSAEDTVFYDAVKYMLENGVGELKVPGTYAASDIDRIVSLVQCDWPSIGLSSAWTATTTQLGIGDVHLTGPVTRISFQASVTDTPERSEQSLRVAKEIIDRMPPYTSELDKTRYLYNWLVRNVAYKADDGTRDSYRYKSLASALIDRQADCDGFANAVTLLCGMAGIESFKVFYPEGEAQDGGAAAGHVWNVVRIDGTYYCLDASYDAGYSAGKEIATNIAFLVPTSLIARDKALDPSVAALAPVCTSTAMDAKVHDVVVYDADADSFVEDASKMLRGNMRMGKDYISIKCASQKTYDELVERMSEEYGPQILSQSHVGSARWVRDSGFRVFYLFVE